MGIRSGGAAVGGSTADVDTATVDVPEDYELVDGGPLAKKVSGTSAVNLLWCPACGHVFGYGGDKQGHLLGHDPEDFGLG